MSVTNFDRRFYDTTPNAFRINKLNFPHIRLGSEERPEMREDLRLELVRLNSRRSSHPGIFEEANSRFVDEASDSRNVSGLARFNIMDPAEYCPPYAPFIGFAGVFSAMAFSCLNTLSIEALGAAYGTSKSGIGIAGIGPFRPELVMKSLIPVVMSGIIAVYGLVVAVLLSGKLDPNAGYSLYTGFVALGAGLSVGFGGLAAGYAIGVVGDYCVRGYARESRLFVSMVLMLIFAEVLGLYGLIVALLMDAKADNSFCK
ncbi:v-type proton ATPase 16 kDa proteolipid subunit 2 [Apophysomyces ossiformis]|uniref:V-type proton ATPase proteolipid subunit n=1 Tax=Apophysomyces ossiformis TaxID=679940 RepID=A0A8H7EPN2_9FUNG|nr:v-type proton ATPase 16 kDa proteolipid subunit 2 [Apophysomyces ossiformis]